MQQPEQPPTNAPERLYPPDPAQQFGAAAAEAAELVDRLTDNVAGDLDRAESEFDAAGRGPVPSETAHPRERD